MRRYWLAGFLVVALGCGEEPSLSSPADEGAADKEREVEPHAPVPVPAEPVEVAPVEALPAQLGPPYPIVLVHGFSGWSDAGPLEYFFDVLTDLEERGEHEVYAPALPPYNGSDQRARVLAAFIDEVIAETGRAKVHLIAHSQGGVDSRRVVSALGYAPKVASLTTVASPHRGTPLADGALVAPDGILNPAGRMLAWLIGAVDSPPNDDWESDGGEGTPADPWQPDMVAAATLLSSDGMAAFNASHPDPEGLPIFSVAAYSNLLPAPALCDDGLWEVPGRVDAMDALLVGSGLYLSGADLFEPRANDGIVPTDSMPWGTLLGCVPADHFDEIGQIADLLPGLISGFDHKALYRRLIANARASEASSAAPPP